jgi:hypothetical protein
VRVAVNLPVLAELDGCGIVRLVGVGEETGVDAVDVELDGEGLVGFDLPKVLRRVELGAGNVLRRGDLTNGSGVARATSELLTIGNCALADAKVDEVVRGRERRNLAGFRTTLLTIVLEKLG